LENLRKTFEEWGFWRENFGDYLFVGKIQASLVHETFFLKDYEIRSNFYVFGKEVPDGEVEVAFLRFVKDSEKLVEIPEDHFLSCLVLICLSGSKKSVEGLYREKFLWFGLKGKIAFVGSTFDGKSLTFPAKIKDKNVRKFLDFLKASTESGL